MRKIMMLLIITLLTVLSLGIKTESSSLTNYGIPYETYTLNASKQLIPTQTAYIPVGNFGRDLGLSFPEDLFIDNDLFYIADTGNKRIVVTDLSGALVSIIELPEFQQPTGLFVKDNYLYVADKLSKEVYKIDLLTDTIVQTIVKPTSPIFGQNNDFVPIKVAVDSSDSIYIVGEGSTSGVIQMNYAGEFIGYLGINTVTLSLRRILYNFFVADPDLAASLPASPTNIALGQKGSILSTNVNVNETFKRLNISGVNTLISTTVYPTQTLSGIWMSQNAYIYLTSENGDVYEYDSNGNLLFYFNTKDNALTQTLGLTSNPKAIVTDNLGNLYILDRGYNAIHVYQRTVFVALVHEAVTLYNDGKYIESKPLWEEIIRQNSSFALAQSALGAALMKEGDYDEALSRFYDANDYLGYSNAFWEVRNVAIQNNLPTFALVLIGVYIALKIGISVFRKSMIYPKYVEKKKALLNQKLVKEVSFSLLAFKNPDDMFYGIKRKNAASYQSGLIVFGLFIIVYLTNIYATGFLFRDRNLNSVLVQLVAVVAFFGLYVMVNYLVSTLNDGEGRFKDVFISTSYILIPFIVLTLPMTLLSNYLTYNETFIFTMYHQVILGWMAILLFLSIKWVHNYTFMETIKNIVIIVFGMFIVVLIGLLIYSFIGQLIEFIISIFRELIYRV